MKWLRLFMATIKAFNLRKPLRHPMTRIRDAATQGDVEAQYQLGEAYLAGWAVPRHPATGAHWLRLAAERGHARAQHSLSLLYMSGAKASGDTASWLRETEASGNAILFYPDGLDVPADSKQALRHAQAAAEQGLACAQANLGMFYLRGIGCKQDFAKAQVWCRRASEQNDPVGALGLGFLNEHGFGTKRDPVEAARCYAIGAELGNDAAATALGLLHLDGIGVERDLTKAHKLMAGPASRGDVMAKRGMSELYTLMEAETKTESDQRNMTQACVARAQQVHQSGGHPSRHNT